MKPVRRIRLLKELTLDEIFLKTNITISKLSRIERGIFKPTDKEKILISETLGEPTEKVFPKE